MPKSQSPTVQRPRYEEIARQLRLQIEAQTLRPGDRLPSSRALCQQYEVWPVTVDKAIGLLEAENLIVRANRSGVYVADPQRKPRTGLIGLCGVAFAKSHFSPYWTSLIEGVEEAISQTDAQIVLLRGDTASGWDKIDGLLVNPGEAIIQVKYLPPHLPLVGFLTPPAKDTFIGDKREVARAKNSISTILVDDYSGIYQATKHLIELGHRRIAYLHNSPPAPQHYHRRLAGYHAALSEAGITPDERWLRALPSPTPFLYFMNAGRTSIEQWLREDWNELGCTALLAHNDDTAWGAVDAFREAGIDVPGQLSVVGYDNTQSAECCDPRLTTVEVPLHRVGQTGVELLFQKIEGEAQQGEVVLPTQLRVRASTAPPA